MRLVFSSVMVLFFSLSFFVFFRYSNQFVCVDNLQHKPLVYLFSFSFFTLKFHYYDDRLVFCFPLVLILANQAYYCILYILQNTNRSKKMKCEERDFLMRRQSHWLSFSFSSRILNMTNQPQKYSQFFINARVL